MKRYWIVALAIILACTLALNSSTINGIANQVIGLTQYAVILGGGTGADVATAAPGATQFALVSNGASSNPSFQALPNAGLANSSITIATAGCMTNGVVSLGATLTPVSTCQPMAGVTNGSVGSTVTWTVASGDVAWTLAANTTVTATVAAGDQWRKVNVMICQDGTGGRTVTWPANVKGAMVPGTTLSKCSTQMFESFDGTNMYGVGMPIINQ